MPSGPDYFEQILFVVPCAGGEALDGADAGAPSTSTSTSGTRARTGPQSYQHPHECKYFFTHCKYFCTHCKYFWCRSTALILPGQVRATLLLLARHEDSGVVVAQQQAAEAELEYNPAHKSRR